ncbi:hypothetical protein AL013_07125 [Mariprofundus ferrooxydans]|nr:hypothetical protein AL013_07125 [Mariprofundus ferrooxydans]
MYLIMFDIDGTLTESYAYDQQAYVDAFFEVTGYRDVNTDWHAYRHVTSHGITAEAIRNCRGRDAEPAEVAAIEQQMLECLQRLHLKASEQFYEVAGASAFLRYLRQRDDVAISIATGCWRSEALFKLEASGIDVDGIPLAASEDGGSRVEIMAVSAGKALRSANLTAFEGVIYFGDALWDVRAAAELGYGFIGIGQRLALLREAGAKFLHRDYSDIKGVVRSLAAHHVGQ